MQFEFEVLVIAELVGTGYYQVLQRRVNDPLIVEVCALVLQDEAKHVDFHAERFAADQASWLPLERAAWARPVLKALFLRLPPMTWTDHGTALRAIGGDPGAIPARRSRRMHPLSPRARAQHRRCSRAGAASLRLSAPNDLERLSLRPVQDVHLGRLFWLLGGPGEVAGLAVKVLLDQAGSRERGGQRAHDRPPRELRKFDLG